MYTTVSTEQFCTINKSFTSALLHRIFYKNSIPYGTVLHSFESSSHTMLIINSSLSCVVHLLYFTSLIHKHLLLVKCTLCKICLIPRGFGFVTFVNPSSVEKVVKKTNHIVDGKKVR